MVYEAIEDAYQAIAYVLTHLKPYRLYLCGASAGGLLAYLAGLRFAAEVAGLILFNPVLNLSVSGFKAKAIPPGGDLQISPLHIPVTSLPKMLIMQGVSDSVTPLTEAKAFVVTLQTANTNARLIEYQGAHGFFNRPRHLALTNRALYEFTQEDKKDTVLFSSSIYLPPAVKLNILIAEIQLPFATSNTGTSKLPAESPTAPIALQAPQPLPTRLAQGVVPQPKPNPKIVFLHIPKTAGQSVHQFLSFFFKPDDISPARVNEQLFMMPVRDIRKYRLFSGHMDWSQLDCVGGPKFTFTILREPVSRIVSFYLYLLREAKALSPEELQLPQNTGKRAILELSCDQYFTAGPQGIRTFLDNAYDNFYAYYFAGRRYDARQKLKGLQSADPAFTNEKIVELALANMKLLDGVYSVDALGRLEQDIRGALGVATGGPALETLRVNTGDANDIDQRLMELEKLGATQATFKRIQAMTVLDQKIWQAFCAVPQLPALKSVS